MRTFLELPHGIPSHDTIGRLFCLLDPKQLQGCFLSWINSLVATNNGEIIAIDGKTLRNSYDRGGTRKALHMVSAWAVNNRLVLGQIKTDEKSNEITAISQLLDILDIKGTSNNWLKIIRGPLKGAVVTLDAMGRVLFCINKMIRKTSSKNSATRIRVKILARKRITNFLFVGVIFKIIGMPIMAIARD